MFFEVESMNNASYLESDWLNIYIINGVSTLIFLVYFLVIMILLRTMDEMPETALETFTLLECDRIAGIFRLEMLILLSIPFYYPFFVRIFASQRTNAALRALLASAHACSLTTPRNFAVHFSYIVLKPGTPDHHGGKNGQSIEYQ